MAGPPHEEATEQEQEDKQEDEDHVEQGSLHFQALQMDSVPAIWSFRRSGFHSYLKVKSKDPQWPPT